MNAGYVHGYSASESTRLTDQANTLTELLHADTHYPAGCQVLEAGCGVGAQTVILAANSTQATFTSIDISAESLAEAQRQAQMAGLTNVAFWQADILDLPFPAARFDHVFVCYGGYVIGGGTVGCGSGNNCPELSGIQCALVEKVSSTGSVVWANAYGAGADGSAISKIRQASDGGLIAVGNTTDSSQNIGGLVLKLDVQGNVQWQRQIGPAGTTDVLLNDVQQTSDGGYVVTGELQAPNSTGKTLAGVLVAKLDSSGNVVWQQSFNSFDSTGAPTASNNALTIIQISDGGYLVGGNWVNAPAPDQCCSGALLLKLDSAGNLQRQNALSGGLYCFFNGFSEQCQNLTTVAYTAHRTSDGGYVLTGDETLKLADEIPLVPWIAKVDSAGNLLWQHLYYQANPSTGRPLSEYFASSAATSDGGFFNGGFTPVSPARPAATSTPRPPSTRPALR